MKLARVLSGFGLTAVTAPVFAHGDHGSMMMTQMVGHVFGGEHLVLVLGIAKQFQRWQCSSSSQEELIKITEKKAA